MGTNYYWYKDKPCPACGRNDEPLHIGKSSAGWVFLLHVIPELGINDLDDWEMKVALTDSYIKNEYDKRITPEEMIDTITKREHPKGLRRCDIDDFRVRHGKGTWDCRLGEFS